MKAVFEGLVFWSLLPLVMPQALLVRRNALRLPSATGPAHGTVGDGPAKRLLAIGDSIIAGVGAEHFSGSLTAQTAKALAERLGIRISWTALGLNGADVNTVLRRLVPQLPGLEADYIIVSVGINDVTSLSRLGAWRNGLAALLSALARHSPRAVIAVAGMPPLQVFPALPQPLRAWLGFRATILGREMQRLVAETPGTVHVPMEVDLQPGTFAEDGYHPSERSYVVFGQGMAEHLVNPLEHKPVLT